MMFTVFTIFSGVCLFLHCLDMCVCVCVAVIMAMNGEQMGDVHQHFGFIPLPCPGVALQATISSTVPGEYLAYFSTVYLFKSGQ